MNTIMNKNYIVPQIEVMKLSSEDIMDSISIVHHSGGGSGKSGFDEGEII
jgi:hypothetical protein